METVEEFYNKAKIWFGENFGGLLEQIKIYAKKVGRIATKPVLKLYFVLKEPSVPTSDKALIIASLIYTVVPGDLIPFRKFGLLGWLDDTISIGYVIKKVSKYSTPAMEIEVEQLLDEWFTEYTPFEEVEK